MAKIELVVTVNYELKYRKMSIILNYLDSLTIKIPLQASIKNDFLYSNLAQQGEAFD